MMHKRLITLALLVLSTPCISHCFDLNEIKTKVMNAAIDIKDNVVPAVEALVAGNFPKVQSYLGRSDNPLIPIQAIEFVRTNVGPAQTIVIQLIDKMPLLPAHVVTSFNGFKAGLGTQLNSVLKTIKAHATVIRTVNVQRALDLLAPLKVRNATAFINDLKADYDIAPDLKPLTASALRLKSTVDTLDVAVKNLMKGDFVPLLKDLIITVQNFVQIKGNRTISEDERLELLDDISNALLALTRKLSGSIREARPFLDAFVPFSKEVMTFTVQLYKQFGTALWKQLPPQVRTKAREGFNLLKAHEAQIKDAMSTIKTEVLKLELF